MYEYMIGAGVMKAGTTLLYAQLVNHPALRKGVRKELHYFDESPSISKEEYDSLFVPGEGIKMDITPFYMYSAQAVENMQKVVDPEKTAVVVLLRDPVERAWSHYRMRLSQGMEKEAFENTFDLEKERTSQSFHNSQLYSYFTRGFYASQLDRLYAIFPKENIRIFLFEDFVKNQQQVVNQVCDFLGIGHIAVEDKHENKTVMAVKSKWLERAMKKIARMVPRGLRADWMRKLRRKVSAANEVKMEKTEMPPQFRQKLIAYYQDDVARLQREYGVDVSRWKNFSAL